MLDPEASEANLAGENDHSKIVARPASNDLETVIAEEGFVTVFTEPFTSTDGRSTPYELRVSAHPDHKLAVVMRRNLQAGSSTGVIYGGIRMPQKGVLDLINLFSEIGASNGSYNQTRWFWGPASHLERLLDVSRSRGYKFDDWPGDLMDVDMPDVTPRTPFQINFEHGVPGAKKKAWRSVSQRIAATHPNIGRFMHVAR